MTWPLRISFSVVLSVALTFALPITAGTVTGRVELRDSEDAAVRKHMDFSGVVVWLEPLNGTVNVTVPSTPARMLQKDKTFIPHVLAITVGTAVAFPNADPIFHNAFSNYNGRTFNVGLYKPGSSRTVGFGRSGIVRVFCNIHSSMSAVIVVLNTPYFSTTQRNGEFKIPDVPPGDYSLKVFHERAVQTTVDKLTRRVTIGAETTGLPAIGISESGYLAIPHQNMFGHEYAPPPDDGSVYPAVRK